MKKIFKAVSTKNLVEVQRLVESDPSLVYERDVNNNMPIHEALMTGAEDIVWYLLSKGSPVNDPGYAYTPILSAARRGWMRLVERLIELGADVLFVDDNNETVMHAAAEYAYKSGDTSVYDYLLPIVEEKQRETEKSISGLVGEVCDYTHEEFIVEARKRAVAKAKGRAGGGGGAAGGAGYDSSEEKAEKDRKFKEAVARIKAELAAAKAEKELKKEKKGGTDFADKYKKPTGKGHKR